MGLNKTYATKVLSEKEILDISNSKFFFNKRFQKPFCVFLDSSFLSERLTIGNSSVINAFWYLIVLKNYTIIRSQQPKIDGVFRMTGLNLNGIT